MKDVRNIAGRPLRVPLPHGKTLHLGPNQTGQVPASALEHPPFQKVLEAGEIEVLGEGSAELPHPTKQGPKTRTTSPGRNPGGIHPSGDR